ncbi:hypothetical protein EMO89_01575 [Bifidobacterium tissieri]|uniref:Uncharacterized protein n=1 Tax=Bifidobacterium tissieri TaxID=1630162 RepID=A0A5M9ZX67_9BIFI|nr:hypothetical protein [Bifidobacterium tissieri]KAA8831452.1 hypothetical protein EMO89_01575 [Bifidobacterium tissieri]
MSICTESIQIIYRESDNVTGNLRTVPLATISIDRLERLHPVIHVTEDSRGWHGRFLKGMLSKTCDVILHENA